MEIITIKNQHGGNFGKAVLIKHEFYDEAGDFGTAISLHEGEPYIGNFGQNAVYGNPQKYVQVWDVTWDGQGWEGHHSDFRGNNNIVAHDKISEAYDLPELAEAVEFAIENGLDFAEDV